MDREPLVPEIEEGIPLPKNSADALPELTPNDELQGIAKTVFEISNLTGEPVIPTEEDLDKAQQIAVQLIKDPKTRPQFELLRDSTKATLAGLVTRLNFQVVEDLIELKNVVINGLLEEIEAAPDSKTRIQALKALGEVDGVDAFKKRSEITHQVKPIEEVEKELLSVLDGIEYRVISEETTPNV
jgi:hypothetical protein